MNLSGQPLPFLLRSLSPLPTLLVLHDSLEHPPLTHTVPRFGVSAKGHNGLRSIESSLKVGNAFWRMSLGIGRPNGRAREGVVDWVMGGIPSDERLYWDGEGVNSVADDIEDFARGLAEGRMKAR
jgi:PTH1 family peptidyl-tRNA hydrolase